MPAGRYHRLLMWTIAAMAASSSVSAQRPGRPLLDDVARAMGGAERILAVRTLMLEGTGEMYNLGQGMSPAAPLPVYAVTGYRRSFDFANRRWRQELTRQPQFITGNTSPQPLKSAWDGVAFDIGADGTSRRSAGRADIDRAYELAYHPIGFIQMALAAGTQVTEAAQAGGLRHVRMNAGGSRYSLFVDSRTKLPVRIEKIVYHPMLGDVVMATRFADWQDAGGIRVPMRITQRLAGRWPIMDTRVVTARINTEVGDLVAPPAVRAASPVPAPVAVTADEVAPGVWHLAGQTHHSVAIEMQNEILLVEAPLNDARTLAVIKRARELRPGKPLRRVIDTHHHFDHAGGLRAAISEGLTIVTHSGNAAFVNDLARQRHSIVGDALSSDPKPARVEIVGAKRVISDGNRSVELHHLRGSPHSATMLIVYLPAEKILIQADAYNPPAAGATVAPSYPFAPNLVDNIDRLRLAVDRIVPIHGPVIPIAQLRSIAEANRKR